MCVSDEIVFQVFGEHKKYFIPRPREHHEGRLMERKAEGFFPFLSLERERAKREITGKANIRKVLSCADCPIDNLCQIYLMTRVALGAS